MAIYKFATMTILTLIKLVIFSCIAGLLSALLFFGSRKGV
jgi:hypothetical protein